MDFSRRPAYKLLYSMFIVQDFISTCSICSIFSIRHDIPVFVEGNLNCFYPWHVILSRCSFCNDSSGDMERRAGDMSGGSKTFEHDRDDS